MSQVSQSGRDPDRPCLPTVVFAVRPIGPTSARSDLSTRHGASPAPLWWYSEPFYVAEMAIFTATQPLRGRNVCIQHLSPTERHYESHWPGAGQIMRTIIRVLVGYR